MHEFSISSEIVRTILDTVKENHGKKVLSVQLEIGELSLVNPEQVTFWIEQLFTGSVAEGAKVKVKKIKPRIRCEVCNYQGVIRLDGKDLFRHLAPLSCPQCGSLQIRIEKGRECLLKRIQAVR